MSGTETPPARDGEIAEIPDLNVGDKIRTEHHGKHSTDRTLTVESVGTDVESDNLAFPGDGDGYKLSGYGTTYHLTTSQSLTGSWQRVDLVWQSRPEGSTVTDITVIERADCTSNAENTESNQ